MDWFVYGKDLRIDKYTEQTKVNTFLRFTRTNNIKTRFFLVDINAQNVKTDRFQRHFENPARYL